MLPCHLCHSSSQHFNCFLQYVDSQSSIARLSLKPSQTNYLCISTYYQIIIFSLLTDYHTIFLLRSPCKSNFAFAFLFATCSLSLSLSLSLHICVCVYIHTHIYAFPHVKFYLNPYTSTFANFW